MWARLLIPILLAAGNLNKEPCPNKFSKLRWRARMRLPAPHYHWKWPLNACSITNTHPFSVLTPDYFHKWHNEPNAQPSSRKKSFGSGSNMLPTSEIPQNHPKWPKIFSYRSLVAQEIFFFFAPDPLTLCTLITPSFPAIQRSIPMLFRRVIAFLGPKITISCHMSQIVLMWASIYLSYWDKNARPFWPL